MVPPLADRREDIPELTRYFVEWFHRSQGLPARPLSGEAEAMLQTMPWPGNIRQLRNVIERILILGDSNGPIETGEIPGNEPKPEAEATLSFTGTIATLPLREARELFEREYLLTQINRFGGNISRTASFVGMERSALHRKLKSLGVVGGAKQRRVAALSREHLHPLKDRLAVVKDPRRCRTASCRGSPASL